MRGRLLDQIKIEHNHKLKQRGGSGFLKHEIQASDVRLSCHEGTKLVDKTKRYLTGEFKKALSNYDARNNFILRQQDGMDKAE